MKACEESLLPMLWDTHIEQLISGIVDAKSGDEAALVAKMRNKLEGLPQSFRHSRDVQFALKMECSCA